MADEYTVQPLPEIGPGQMNSTDPSTGQFLQNPHQALSGGIGALVQLNNQLQGAKLSDQMMAQRRLVAHMQAMKEQEAERSANADALARQFIQDNPDASMEEINRFQLGAGAGGSLAQAKPYGIQSLKSATSAANTGARVKGTIANTLLKGGVNPDDIAGTTENALTGKGPAGEVMPAVQGAMDLQSAKVENLASKTNLTDIVAEWKPSVFDSQIGLMEAGARLKNAAAQLDAMKTRNGGQIPSTQADRAIKNVMTVNSQISSIQSRLDNNLMMKASDKAAARQRIADLQNIADAMVNRLKADKAEAPEAPVGGTSSVINAKDPLGILNAR